MTTRDTATTHLNLITEGQPTLNFSCFGTDTASERTTVRLRRRSAGAVRLAEGARLADYPGHLTLYREPPPEPGQPKPRPFNAILWEKAPASGASRPSPYYVVQLYVPDAVYDAVSRAALFPTCRLELQLEVPGLVSRPASGTAAETNGGPDRFADFYLQGALDILGYSISITHAERPRTARVKAQAPLHARAPDAHATRRAGEGAAVRTKVSEGNRAGRRASA